MNEREGQENFESIFAPVFYLPNTEKAAGARRLLSESAAVVYEWCIFGAPVRAFMFFKPRVFTLFMICSSL